LFNDGENAWQCATQFHFRAGLETVSTLLKVQLTWYVVPWPLSLQRRHVDHKSVFHIVLQHPLVRLIDLIHSNHFHI
jgi:hypothetical protein